MKRIHIHVSVSDIQASIRFYSELFCAAPTVQKPDYSRWMLDNSRVSFAISLRGAPAGFLHLGIQVEDRARHEEIYGRLRPADRLVLDEGLTTYCYARSEKRWIEAPEGLRGETFLTNGGDRFAIQAKELTCCGPTSCAPRAA